MKNLLIFVVLSISLILGTSDAIASHHWHGGGWNHGGGWGGGGWHHHGGGWNNGWNNNGWNGNDWVGAAVGVAAMAIILNQANGGYYGGQPYYRSYNNYYYRCGWVRGHYDYYGYWIPRHRVCWH